MGKLYNYGMNWIVKSTQAPPNFTATMGNLVQTFYSRAGRRFRPEACGKKRQGIRILHQVKGVSTNAQGQSGPPTPRSFPASDSSTIRAEERDPRQAIPARSTTQRCPPSIPEFTETAKAELAIVGLTVLARHMDIRTTPFASPEEAGLGAPSFARSTPRLGEKIKTGSRYLTSRTDGATYE